MCVRVLKVSVRFNFELSDENLQFLNDRSHASIIGDLSLLIAVLLDAVNT